MISFIAHSRLNLNVQINFIVRRIWSTTYSWERFQIISVNITEKQKQELLQNSAALVFTPKFEHFGIVPIEAVLAGCHVIAHAAAGPLESLSYAPERTSFMLWHSPMDCAQQMMEILNQRKKSDSKLDGCNIFIQENFAASFIDILKKW